jgi:regulator of protease activity HflC (stomatin/prohibitin superfamily)
MGPLFIALGAAMVYVFGSLRILRQYERGVTFFLGKYWGTKGPGLVFVPALFSHMVRVSLRTMAMDVPPQDVITRDNVSIKVNAVLYMKVKNPNLAVIEIENYLYATSQLAQTTLRSVLGEVQLDEVLADREKINAILKKIVDTRTEAWGIEVSAVEVKDVDLPPEMKRAMARQAEAERERRAKVIAAEGEYQASGRLAEAAHVISQEPAALTLRYLQTVVEVAAENKSTLVLPVPLDLLSPFVDFMKSRTPALPSSTGIPLRDAIPVTAPAELLAKK